MANIVGGHYMLWLSEPYLDFSDTLLAANEQICRLRSVEEEETSVEKEKGRSDPIRKSRKK